MNHYDPATPRTAETLVTHLQMAAADARLALDLKRQPGSVPGIRVTADDEWPGPTVSVRVWIRWKEVVRLDLRFGSDSVGSRFDYGESVDCPYVDGVEHLLAFWRDRVSAELQNAAKTLEAL